MEVIPAIDLRGGQVVRLRQGDYDQETVYSTDPVGTALAFQRAGAHRLHVVDLDGAASGTPAHLDACWRIVQAVRIPVQMGGGLRTIDTISAVIASGVRRAVLGTAAVEDPALVEEAIARHGPQAVVVGLDAREGMVALHGWKEQSAVEVEELMERMAALGVARFIHTDIARDGTLAGPNFDAVASVMQKAQELGVAVVASGGISATDHLRRLAGLGVEGAILGSAVYTGTLPLADALRAVRARH